MTPDQWRQVETLFDKALDLPKAEWATFLEEAKVGDVVRDRVFQMLLADEEANTFLETPAADVAESLVEEQEEGRQIGVYRIVRALGEGGMGLVYLAERTDGQFEHQVALKLIKRGMDSDLVLRRFLQERQILARLQHPGIARLLDGDITPEGQPYFVMEYIQGMPITEYSTSQELDLDTRLSLFQETCAAVQYAHRNLVVHRDLKSSNILVTTEGRVKLLDFGIAKMLIQEEPEGETALLTRTGQLVLTPAYAAPEQVRGQSVTTATDVYALGVLLYELLTDSRPYDFDSLTPTEIERVVCEVEPARPSTLLRKTQSGDPATTNRIRAIRGDLDTIVMMAMRKEPERRYQTVEQLADDIQRYFDQLPIRAQEESIRYKTRKFVQRHRAGVVAALVVFVALVAGLTVALWQMNVAATERDRAQTEASKAEETASFLRELFVASDPTVARGDTLTVYEILDRGATRIQTDLEEQPLVRGMLLGELGRIYDNLGLYARADSFLQDAIALQRTVLPDEHVDIAANLLELSQIKDQLGDYETSKTLAEEALAMRYSLLDPNDPDLAHTMDWVASILAYEGNLEEAEPISRAAVAILESNVGEEDIRTATAWHNLAWMISLKGEYEEAEKLYRRVVAVGRRTLGEKHPDVQISIGALALTLRRLGKLDEAEALYREELALRRQTGGEDHVLVGNTLHNLAFVQQQRGALAEAASLFEEAIALWRAQLGPEHPNIATALSNLANNDFLQEKMESAASRYDEAIVMQRVVYPENHPRRAETLLRYGRLLIQAERKEDALPLIQEAFAIRKKVFGEGHFLYMEAQAILGLASSGNEQDSLIHLSLPILKAEKGEGDPLVQQLQDLLVN